MHLDTQGRVLSKPPMHVNATLLPYFQFSSESNSKGYMDHKANYTKLRYNRY